MITKGGEVLQEDKKRDFVFDIFKNNLRGENLNDLSAIEDRIRGYKEYAERKKQALEMNDGSYEWYLENYKDIYDFPEEVELSSEDIRKLIEMVNGLDESGYWNASERKSGIMSFIFKNITDDSKVAFFRSDEFQELYSNSEWKMKFFEREHIDVVWETMSEEKQTDVFEGLSLKEEANLKIELGLLDSNLSLKEAIKRYCDSMSEPDSSYNKMNQKNLEMLLSLRNIDMDLSEFSSNGDKEIFLRSDEFKNIVNMYYQTLDDTEKHDFVRDLSYGPKGPWGHEWIYYNSDVENMNFNLQIFNALEDNSKFNFAQINILAGALENDFLEDSQRLDTVFRMYEINKRDDYIYKYFDRIQEGEFARFDLDSMQIEALIAKQDEYDDKLLMGIFSSMNPENIMDYLREQPENISFCMNALSFDEVNEILSEIDGDEYKAKLLLSLNADSKTVAAFFPHIEDDYVRAQLVIAKSNNEVFVDEEHTLYKINNFLEIKDEFMTLPEEQRADYLCNIEGDDPQDPTSSAYKDCNEIKKSLLKHIDNPDDRKKVIESMGRYVQPDIQEYVDMAEQMVREYIEDNLELTPEQLERFEIELRTNDVYFTDYNNGSTNGQTDAVTKEITIANHSRGDTQNIIIDMLHEYSHAFSRSDFIKTAYSVGHTFEEGMADTFAEQVANHYFSKYGSVEISGEVFEPELPLVSQSGYHFENGWAKSMLYPLEETGQDKSAIQEFVFGDKNTFFDMVMGEGFSQGFEHDYAGNPVGVKFNTNDLAEIYPGSFHSIDRDSLYLIKNSLINELSEKAQEIYGKNPIVGRLESDGIRFRTSCSCYIYSL